MNPNDLTLEKTGAPAPGPDGEVMDHRGTETQRGGEEGVRKGLQGGGWRRLRLDRVNEALVFRGWLMEENGKSIRSPRGVVWHLKLGKGLWMRRVDLRSAKLGKEGV